MDDGSTWYLVMSSCRAGSIGNDVIRPMIRYSKSIAVGTTRGRWRPASRRGRVPEDMARVPR